MQRWLQMVDTAKNCQELPGIANGRNAHWQRVLADLFS